MCFLDGRGKDRALRNVRESWRECFFPQRWLRSGRHDALSCAGVGYCSRRLKAAAELYRKGSSHVRAGLTGGAVSDAWFGVAAHGAVPERCRWCDRQVVPSWFHETWECSAFRESRPTRPREPLKDRLGWPTGMAGDRAVIHHMAQVREAVS